MVSPEVRGSPWCGHRANPCPMLRNLTLPTVKNPNLEVSNFLQPPETLTWLSNAAGDLGKTESTGGKGKEMKAMQVYVWGGWGRGDWGKKNHQRLL